MNKKIKIGSADFEIGKRTYVVGILNVTPDSFSDGGAHHTLPSALAHARRMAADGADIIEIGGESTRPGFTPVDAEEEAIRILPVIAALKKELQLPLSIDTMKASVAEKALLAGADLINDVTCLRHDPDIAGVCARYSAPLCLMHSRADMQDTQYTDLLDDIKTELSNGIDTALKAGVMPEQLIIDPGLGFSKNESQNLEIIRSLDFFSTLPYPLMLGASRKRFIGSVLGGLPADSRLEGVLAVTAVGIARGCDFIRVHDVKENKRAAQMADAILRR